MKNEKYSAFVIMAFDPEFEAIYSDIIRPSLEEVGYEVTRADSIMNQQNILKDIVRGIAHADIIIAELTALNANVFYELGIAHALRKPTILLTQSVEDVPFDLRSYRVVVYSTRFNEIKKLSDVLMKMGEKAKHHSLDFSNPVIDFLPQELPLIKSDASNNSLPSTIPETPTEIEEEKGLWDFVVDGEAAVQKSNEVITRLTEATVDIGKRMSTRTAEVGQIQKSGVAGSSAKMYKLVELMASDILSFASKMEEELTPLHSAWETFSESATGMLRTTKIRTSEDQAAAQEFRGQLITLSNAISEGLASMKGFRGIQAQLKGIRKSMNRASRKATSALDKIISEFEQSIAYTTKVIGLLDEMISQYNNGHAI